MKQCNGTKMHGKKTICWCFFTLMIKKTKKKKLNQILATKGIPTGLSGCHLSETHEAAFRVLKQEMLGVTVIPRFITRIL